MGPGGGHRQHAVRCRNASPTRSLSTGRIGGGRVGTSWLPQRSQRWLQSRLGIAYELPCQSCQVWKNRVGHWNVGPREGIWTFPRGRTETSCHAASHTAIRALPSLMAEKQVTCHRVHGQANIPEHACALTCTSGVASRNALGSGNGTSTARW